MFALGEASLCCPESLSGNRGTLAPGLAKPFPIGSGVKPLSGLGRRAHVPALVSLSPARGTHLQGRPTCLSMPVLWPASYVPQHRGTQASSLYLEGLTP